ncbi:beta-ketoacyl synthase N-terminal-like domain-containing protein [Xenorhabdus griffiniae]|uniref:beta-ketoacyl synthase N-terminal-like domain-containing protein n=1 Tax=Xenorhabdus griffiniae TaxID=351672 RepID=UPI002359CF08|nr:beta-ketoacyl synthase N-terminal-like domain-containing protein [Xenorhabdus griffiniae]MDC9605742.1 beta-ketoacyl synthase N-terminal-like domain-containing protein [Xenorhabdus griffiniae]
MSFTEYDIAICGIGFILPGGIDTPEGFDQLKQQGNTLIQDFRVEFHDATEKEIFRCGYIEDIYKFSYKEFGLTKKQASLMDPQQRILLKLSKKALKDAGIDTPSTGNRIGAFFATGINYYLFDNLLKNSVEDTEFDIHNIIRLNDSTFAATRIASTLGLQGPAISVQSACSSSVSAIHVGCQSILSGESEMALVGACSLLLPQHRRFTCRDGDILAHDGICRPLDIAATGTVASSGGAVFLLRTAQSAIKSGSKIYAIIKATSLNNDGGGKSSFGAPSIFGQKTVIEEGLSIANINANQLSYHELHGTATILGDLIEMESTSSAFSLSAKDSVALGAIKSQIGHTDTASGLFGIINSIYSLVHRCVPPIANFRQLNPKITPFITGFSNLYQQSQLSNAEMLFGSISSFGIGGTNGFVVLAVNNACLGWQTPYPEYHWEEEQECYIPLKIAKQIILTPLQPESTEQLTDIFILDILEKLLGEEIKDTTLNFYDMGGDSILLLDFIDILKKKTGTTLPLNALISSPTISELVN